jgi:Macrocin-O-methyltransferase (TylF)
MHQQPQLPASVFDDSHHAATLPRKLWRALQLGPKYYLLDLPRYFAHRRSCKLPVWDTAALTNPLREFWPRGPTADALPPHYQEALDLFAKAGIALTIPRERLGKLLQVWWETRAVRGDAIECGSFRGATSLLIALLGRLNGLQQKVLMLDTFAGMPAVSSYDLSRHDGEFQPPADQVTQIAKEAEILGVAERIEIHQGRFTQTFAALAARDPRFAFVHIDANIYQGTLEACQFTVPRVCHGGAVVFDDYNGVCDLGARLAIDEYFAGQGIKPLPLTASSACVRLRVGSKP